ncbi:hypothetical protein [Acutalibacter sp. 1XD8-36]|uniref:hypothetical protein n=1 Tax=Acutalibacter sp. 1XD8-36 TaxID=2320852 RepID=UPI0014125DFD|nr:hypothetical protein [Acutalibacter sp. 1XD8-36]NBJ89644.1 hypothetical protein [Acutalibacter sp. 1XD8-36]
MKKKMRVVYTFIAVIYFIAVIFATVYAQTGYIGTLPSVELGRVTDGRIPKKCTWYDTEKECLRVNTVVQEDGPWGKRYVIHTKDILNYRELDEESIVVFGVTEIKEPIVVSAEREVFSGQEVRLKSVNEQG